MIKQVYELDNQNDKHDKIDIYVRLKFVFIYFNFVKNPLNLILFIKGIYSSPYILFIFVYILFFSPPQARTHDTLLLCEYQFLVGNTCSNQICKGKEKKKLNGPKCRITSQLVTM